MKVNTFEIQNVLDDLFCHTPCFLDCTAHEDKHSCKAGIYFYLGTTAPHKVTNVCKISQIKTRCEMLLLPFLHKKFFLFFFCNSALFHKMGKIKSRFSPDLIDTRNVKEAERSFDLLLFCFVFLNFQTQNQVGLGLSRHSAFSEQALW